MGRIHRQEGGVEKKVRRCVLDVSCGSRMFYFNKSHPSVIYAGIRRGNYIVKDKKSKAGWRNIVIRPDIQADFRMLPFRNDTFSCVIFDPPHLIEAGENSWLYKKYGVIPGNWKSFLSKSFSECWRVLRRQGVLVFKWSDTHIKTSDILRIVPEIPLFGIRQVKTAGTHWMVFVKT